MKLSSEKEHLVLENQKFVHYLVRKLGITPNSSEYEDIVSIGMIGLVKAAITFDSSRKIKFSTYASRCINNEIFMHYRKANKYANDISIDEPIGNDGEGKELTLEDTLEDPNSNFVEKIVNKEDFIKLISIVLNYLETRNRIIMLYRIGNTTQSDIAKMLQISRSYVSKIESKAAFKIRKVANQQVHYKEVFSMAIIGDKYRISFSSKDISKFNKIFATLLQNVTSTEDLPDFKVNCNKERITVQIPAHPESFSFVAQIIQEIDDFSMTFASDKSTSLDNTVSQKVESDDKNESDDTVEEIESSSIEQNSVNETIETIEKTRHTSQSKKIREFILTLDNFSVKQVISEFPDVPTAIVNNVIRLSKTKGLITCIARDEYVVNKI